MTKEQQTQSMSELKVTVKYSWKGTVFGVLLMLAAVLLRLEGVLDNDLIFGLMLAFGAWNIRRRMFTDFVKMAKEAVKGFVNGNG